MDICVKDPWRFKFFGILCPSIYHVTCNSHYLFFFMCLQGLKHYFRWKLHSLSFLSLSHHHQSSSHRGLQSLNNFSFTASQATHMIFCLAQMCTQPFNFQFSNARLCLLPAFLCLLLDQRTLLEKVAGQQCTWSDHCEQLGD